MAYKTTPKTDEEIQRDGLTPEGKYPFEVMKVESKMSKEKPDKPSRPMLATSLKLFPESGGTPWVNDYIMAGDNYSDRKQRHFFEAVGTIAEYESGNIDDEQALVGKTGWLELEIQKGKKKDNSDERWPDRNSVRDYCKPITSAQATTPVDTSSDIPF